MRRFNVVATKCLDSYLGWNPTKDRDGEIFCASGLLCAAWLLGFNIKAVQRLNIINGWTLKSTPSSKRSGAPYCYQPIVLIQNIRDGLADPQS